MTFESKLGTAKGIPRSRVWLEGQRLIASGFTVGARYNRATGLDRITLTLAANGKYKTSGKGASPIIDITGANVTTLLGAKGEKCSIDYSPGLIIIKPVNI